MGLMWLLCWLAASSLLNKHAPMAWYGLNKKISARRGYVCASWTQQLWRFIPGVLSGELHSSSCRCEKWSSDAGSDNADRLIEGLWKAKRKTDAAEKACSRIRLQPCAMVHWCLCPTMASCRFLNNYKTNMHTFVT